MASRKLGAFFWRDHKGRAIHYIFVFLKKENKGCRCYPSRENLIKSYIFERKSVFLKNIKNNTNLRDIIIKQVSNNVLITPV